MSLQCVISILKVSKRAGYASDEKFGIFESFYWSFDCIMSIYLSNGVKNLYLVQLLTMGFHVKFVIVTPVNKGFVSTFIACGNYSCI